MRMKGALYAVLAVLVILALGGCDLIGGPSGPIAMGNLFVPYNVIPGGTAFHVVFYGPGTSMDPRQNYGSAPQAASLRGVFAGDSGSLTNTVNFLSMDIPAGLYSVFAWIDFDGSGSFEAGQDLWGFYYGNPGGNTQIQPPANVVIPETGIVDLDLWFGYNAG